MGNKASPPVPAGLKWCHGCEAALPLTAFGTRKSRGGVALNSRCAPCLRAQRSDHKQLTAELQARWAAHASAPRAAPLALPETLDLG